VIHVLLAAARYALAAIVAAYFIAFIYVAIHWIREDS
jgi:hypothetical protein